jgi:hypothetical protein
MTAAKRPLPRRPKIVIIDAKTGRAVLSRVVHLDQTRGTQSEE